jgi:SNF2 family DNA or RNA helicase
VIVWAAFTHEIRMISEALSRIGSCVTFFGETSQDERLENVHSFQDGSTRFFVANPRAGGFGLNLQNCHIQYFYSRDLQPAANWQAEARSHRNGQKHACVYKTLVARGTVDERVEDLLNKNTDLRMAVRDMTIQDIVSII